MSMDKYSSDPLEEARAAVTELERRGLNKTAGPAEDAKQADLLKASKDRVKQLERELK